MTGKEKDKMFDICVTTQTSVWKRAFVLIGLNVFFAVVIYVCIVTAGVGLSSTNSEIGKVAGRVSRSIEGFPDAGKNIVNAIVQRNALVELDPDYLRDRHKSASKRRVKKVLKLDDYWKFRNEMEAAGKNGEGNYDEAGDGYRSLAIHEDYVKS